MFQSEHEMNVLLEAVRAGLKAKGNDNELIGMRLDSIRRAWNDVYRANLTLSEEVHRLTNETQEKNALLDRYRAMESVLMRKDPKEYPYRVAHEVAMGRAEHPMKVLSMEGAEPKIVQVTLAKRREQLEEEEAKLKTLTPADADYQSTQARVSLLNSMVKGRESRGEE